MNLTELKKTVSDAIGMKRDDVEKVVKAATSSIADALMAGGSVVCMGFWCFHISIEDSNE
ncbi:MAG: HU family DNA-binding protein [Magnetococcales bacterium]|nr:HU family DNA-binding protein [Magnetococcales bacterium]MBF0419926.1 HU family DNA-binding protein [Magnetococcales bacterium]